MADRVTFTPGSAERIAKVVRIVEAGNRDTAGLPTSPRLGGSTRSLRVGTFTGDWQVHTYKTVTFTNSTNTVEVYNWCSPVYTADLEGTATARHVVFGSASGTQSAVELPLGRNIFRVCTFSGSWSINSAKTVTFKNQTTTPNTASATNLFWPIPNGPTRDCAIAKEGTAWYLLVPQMHPADFATSATITTAAIEFKTLPGVALASSSTVVFTIDIATCATT